MAPRRPTRPLLQEIRVIDVSNKNVSRHFLFLEMAFQAERGVAFIQQALVDGAVRRMADDTTLPQCLVLINKWAALLRVTLEAGFISAQERETASFKRLLNICRRAFDRDPLVRLMTIGAAHFAFRHGVMVRQLECRANFQVTLEARVRRLPRIDDGVRRSAAFYVQTPRPVTRFAAHVLGVLPLCLQSRVGRCPEIARDLFVARRAFLRADKLRARNAGWRQNGSVCGAAGKQNDGQRYCSSRTPQQAFAPTVNPSS